MPFVRLTSIRGKLDAVDAAGVVWFADDAARFETPVTTTGAENVAPWSVEREKWILAGEGSSPAPGTPAVRHATFSERSGPTAAVALSTVGSAAG